MGTNFTDIPTTAPVIAATFNDPLDELDQAIERVLGQGTSFPGSPTEGDRFWRTDQNRLYVYSGSAWQEIKIYEDTPYAFLYRTTSNQSIANSTTTKVQLNANFFSNNMTVDIATNFRVTATRAGIYNASGMVRFAAGAAGTAAIVYIYVNGVARLNFVGRFVGSGGQSFAVSGPIQLAANDFVELYCDQATGGAVDAQSGAANTFLGLTRLAG